jgi:hypothetical protein
LIIHTNYSNKGTSLTEQSGLLLVLDDGELLEPEPVQDPTTTGHALAALGAANLPAPLRRLRRARGRGLDDVGRALAAEAVPKQRQLA